MVFFILTKELQDLFVEQDKLFILCIVLWEISEPLLFYWNSVVLLTAVL